MPPDDHVLTQLYNLAPPVTLTVLSEQVYLVQTADREYALKIYPDSIPLDTQRYEHWILTGLAQQSLSFELPIPIRSQTGAMFYTTPEGEIWTLSRKLKGEWMKPNDPDQAYAVGSALAELHRALATMLPMPRPDAPIYTLERRVLPFLQGELPADPAALGIHESAEGHHRWRRFLYLARQFQTPPPAPHAALPWHLIHGDFFGANILYNGDVVSGVLDFKMAHPDYRAREFAEILLRVTNDLGSLFWGTARSFVEGYAATLKLTRPEINLVPRFLVEYHVERVLASSDPAQAAHALRVQEDVSAWLEIEQPRLEAMLRGVFLGE